MKFYGVVFGNWEGIDWDGLYSVFSNESDAENDCERRNDYCGPDEYFEVWEMTEEDVNKYWGDYPIS